MNKFRLLAVTLFAMLAATAWAQDDYVNDETVPDNDETLAEVIDSKQYNKWTSSKNFVLGVKSMTQEIDAVATDDAEVDETEPYKSAIALFKKELKQHPRNAYAKCNIAICETHVASISLNKTLTIIGFHCIFDITYSISVINIISFSRIILFRQLPRITIG